MGLPGYLDLIAGENTQTDTITSQPVRMDGEMVHVSTDTGEGATGLQTWERAHTEEEVLELEKATMNETRCRFPH